MHVNQGPSSLTIRSRQGDYLVEFHERIEEAVTALIKDESSRGSDIYVVCDENVARLHEQSLAPLLDLYPTLILPATEETKALSGVSRLVDWLIEHRAVRTSTVIAVGGGCIQDLVSFTAHLYYRGISWIFLPTTVLSQADSCIGAKSGINVLPFKNQLGVLHSPREIFVAAEFLETLPDLEVASGYGEIVKLSVTSSRHFLTLLESALAEGGLRNPHLLELTHASLAAKQEIIEEDEYESDLRRILNYGHSFGHALEALSNHQIPHGLGVLWGIDIINALSVQWGVTSTQIASRLTQLIRGNFDYSLPLVPTADELVDMLARDKKVAHGKMHFALLVDEGEFVLDPRPLNSELRRQVAEYLETDFVFRPE